MVGDRDSLLHRGRGCPSTMSLLPLSGSANYVFDAAHLRTLAYCAFGVGGTCVAEGVAEVADDLLWDR